MLKQKNQDLYGSVWTKLTSTYDSRVHVSWRTEHTRYVTLKSTAAYELWLLNSVSAAVKFVD